MNEDDVCADCFEPLDAHCEECQWCGCTGECIEEPWDEDE